ncbi:hypothetical protein BH10PSE12_BH10PSE12_35470 [soil metagenome]
MGMLGRIATTIVGTRIAAETGKAGLVGTAIGMVATRIITRSPMGALMVGGAYVAHKLIQKKRQIDLEGPHQTAIDDGLAKPGSPAPAKQRAPYRKPHVVKAKAPTKAKTPVRRHPARP